MKHRADTPALAMSHPTVIRYVSWVLVAGIPTLAIPAFTGVPAEPFLLLLVYGVLLGGAVFAARRSGPHGVRRLFRGALRWRIGWRNWLLAAGSLPIVTVALALATGTYVPPGDWLGEIGDYLFLTFIFGALILNVFEETAWQGLVQRHLTSRHGPLKAAALTAVPFAAVHLPLSFLGDPPPSEALIATALLCLLAPAMRFAMGWMDARSGGSLLAVGVMHASFNASGQLGVLDGDWQPIAALAVITTVFLMIDARRVRVAPQLGNPRRGGESRVPAKKTRRESGLTLRRGDKLRGGVAPSPDNTGTDTSVTAKSADIGQHLLGGVATVDRSTKVAPRSAFDRGQPAADERHPGQVTG